MPEVAKALANAFFDTAATVFLYKPEIFEQVSCIIGSNKILFGTDYPLMQQNRVLAQIQSSQLSEKDKTRILGANAYQLLGRDKRSRSVTEP
jgi:predicted TIM-barrel fold metal-dependent hydrolase